MDAIYTFQTNVRFNKDKYNIKFKEIELQLFNGGKEYQDYIRLSYDSLKEEEIYFILTEFLSCLSLSLDAIFIPPSYNISSTYISQNPKPSEKRQIICTKNERHDFIRDIAKSCVCYIRQRFFLVSLGEQYHQQN